MVAQGAQTPPLITSSPASTPLSEAGVLGQPDTTVLFGGQELNPGLHAGGRISFGTWLGNCEESGVEMNYFIIGQNQQEFTASGADTPVLARPFFDTSIGAESSQVISYPNAWVGSGSVVSTESLQGAEVLWRQAIVHPGGDGRVDMLMGYRFARLIDGLLISDTATSSGTGAISPGTQFEFADSFHTRNDFNGADLGFSTQWRRGRLDAGDAAESGHRRDAQRGGHRRLDGDHHQRRQERLQRRHPGPAQQQRPAPLRPVLADAGDRRDRFLRPYVALDGQRWLYAAVLERRGAAGRPDRH